MYVITQNIDHNTVEIKSTSDGVYAKLYLNDGGSLQELILNNIKLISDLSPLTYKSTYASAILFPFANRIEDGTYRFNEKQFQFATNNKEENNALHGLVYNKLFSIKATSTDKDSAQLILEYEYDPPEDSFPFPFNIQLKYTFTKNRLDLNVLVENKTARAFPFTIGWHPYFFSENLNKSFLDFESHLKLNIGDRNIGRDLQEVKHNDSLSLNNKSLDDCWLLDGNNVIFKTPAYSLNLSSSEPNSFLQVYTPPKKNTIALEPTTGVSNSFNNKIGLKVLKPNNVFDITWSLKIDAY